MTENEIKQAITSNTLNANATFLTATFLSDLFKIDATAALDRLSPPTSSSRRPPPYPSSKPPPSPTTGPTFLTSGGCSSLTNLLSPTTTGDVPFAGTSRLSATGFSAGVPSLPPSFPPSAGKLVGKSRFSEVGFCEWGHGRRPFPPAAREPAGTLVFPGTARESSTYRPRQGTCCSCCRNHRFPAKKKGRRSAAATRIAEGSAKNRPGWWLTRYPTLICGCCCFFEGFFYYDYWGLHFPFSKILKQTPLILRSLRRC
ncbi:UNVERIFIED_CONTAM: hypothetical protein Sradi_2900600 [Sesamum radiatum]|uniref:Uncharacterized protein n=1 Tax=Sesamum radiatum TaxID=300843 RepID=A0AAW2RXW1_SESRA